MATNSNKDSTATEGSGLYSATEAEAAVFDLEPHLVSLMFDEPFYSKILRGVTKIRTDQVPTAGVSVSEGEVKLYWNPRFLASIYKDGGPEVVKGLNIHECLHLVFEHCTTRRHTPHLVWNYATDCAINSLIPTKMLPEEGIIPGKPAKEYTAEEEAKIIASSGEEGLERCKRIGKFIEELPVGLSSEEYFALWMQQEDMKKAARQEEALKKLAEELGEAGIGDMDEHGEWGEGLSDEEKEFVKGKLRKAVEDAVNECDQKGQWGSVSSDARATIKELISREIPWESVLKQFCGMSRRANRTSDRRRLNRKYPNIHSGTKRNYTASIAVYIDQSGSVGDDELAMLFGELGNLAKNIEFTTFHFDTEVDEASETVWRPGKTPAPHRTRCGGTCFEAPSKHAEKNNRRFDGYLILTDGYAPDPGPSRMRRGWVITPNGAKQFKSNRDFDIVMKQRKQCAA